MPFLTARMTKEEQETMKAILKKDHQGIELVEFINGLLHKAFSEGMIHNS